MSFPSWPALWQAPAFRAREEPAYAGISPETFPTCEFWRGNFGGRFGTMMKLAGWDGVVVEGKADKPVWINIINDQVKIEDAKELWGLDTWETQDRIRNMVGGRTRFGEEWQADRERLYHGPPTDRLHWSGRRDQVKTRRPDHRQRGQRAHRRLRRGLRGEESESHQRHRDRQRADGRSQGHCWRPDSSICSASQFGAIPSLAQPGAASCMPCLRSDRRRNNYHGGETMCADQFWLRAASRAADLALPKPL